MFGLIKAYFEKRRAKRLQRLHAAAAAYLKTIYTPPPKAKPKPSPEEDLSYMCASASAGAFKVSEPNPAILEERKKPPYSPSRDSDSPTTYDHGVRYSITSNVPSHFSTHCASDDFALLKTSASEQLLAAKLEKTFLEELNFYIRTKGLTAPVVYQRANMDKRHYSKLISGIVNPTRDVAIALAIALRLNDAQAQTFIGKAGYALSTRCERDVLVRFCLQQGLYNINEINLLLDSFQQKGF